MSSWNTFVDSVSGTARYPLQVIHRDSDNYHDSPVGMSLAMANLRYAADCFVTAAANVCALPVLAAVGDGKLALKQPGAYKAPALLVFPVIGLVGGAAAGTLLAASNTLRGTYYALNASGNVAYAGIVATQSAVLAAQAAIMAAFHPQRVG